MDGQTNVSCGQIPLYLKRHEVVLRGDLEVTDTMEDYLHEGACLPFIGCALCGVRSVHDAHGNGVGIGAQGYYATLRLWLPSTPSSMVC